MGWWGSGGADKKNTHTNSQRQALDTHTHTSLMQRGAHTHSHIRTICPVLCRLVKTALILRAAVLTLRVTFKTNVLSFRTTPPTSTLNRLNEDTSPFPRPSPLSPPVAPLIFFLSSSSTLLAARPSTSLPLPLSRVAPFHLPPPPTLPDILFYLPPTSPPQLSHPLLTLSLSPHIAPISRRLPAAPTRYSSLVLLQSPAQLSDPLPLPLPGPLIKACRTASPWAEERESTGWGDEGIGA